MPDEINSQQEADTTGTTTSDPSQTTTAMPSNNRKINNTLSKWIDKADEKLAQGDASMWKEMITDSTAKKIDENGIIIRDENNRQVFRMSDEEFKEKYGFSRESARSDAAARKDADGKPIYVMKTRTRKSSITNTSSTSNTETVSDTSVKKTFIVSFSGGEEPSFDPKKTTSYQIYDDIKKRLENMYNANWQYSHRVIINQLLDDALKMYGF